MADVRWQMSASGDQVRRAAEYIPCVRAPDGLCWKLRVFHVAEMFKRLLIAAPVAAAVVAALYLALDSLVFPSQIEQPGAACVFFRRPDGTLVCHCGPRGREEYSSAKPANELIGPPPSPPRVRLEQPKPQGTLPRERFPPPEMDELRSILQRDVVDHCERYRAGPVRTPGNGRKGGYALLRFTVNAKGETEDVRIIESSNAAMNDEIVEMVRGWRFVRPPGCDSQFIVKDAPEVRTMRFEIG